MQLAQFIPTSEPVQSLVSSVFIEELYFDELIKKFPQEEVMVSRVAKFLSEATNDKWFDSQELYDIIKPPSLFILSEVLAYLVGTNTLKRIVRLSVDGVGTYDFDSVTDVPDEVLNPITKKMVVVLKEHVKIFYQIIKKSS